MTAAAGASRDRYDRHHHYPILSLPVDYLRAMDKSNFDPSTLQRSDVPVDPETGKKMLVSGDTAPLTENVPEIEQVVREDDGGYRIFWRDGLESVFSDDWVHQQLWRWKGNESLSRSAPSSAYERSTLDEEAAATVERVLWSGLSEKTFRETLSMSFPELVTHDGMKCALRFLYQYGILLVTSTPIGDGGMAVAAMASALGGGSVKNSTTLLHHFQQQKEAATSRGSGSSSQVGGGCTAPTIVLPRGTDGPLRTLYGTVWSTTSTGPHGQNDGTSVADSAYGHLGLPLHTDMTYLADPPGLQVFTMVSPAPRGGGASTFCDGFAVADKLRKNNRTGFDALASIPRRYRSVDPDTGWNLEATGPVLTLRRPGGDEVTAVRHNDLDRLPDLPPLPPAAFRSDDADSCASHDDFYLALRDAHAAWDALLNDDEFRLVVDLRKGDTVIVANQVRSTHASSN
jgi:alpha-ketoglutarate-dependent taurine dioxygenase